jgi:hypothetical protein
MKTTLVLLSTTLLFLSCSEKKDDSGPKTITTVSQNFIDDESAVTKELADLGIDYSMGRRKFAGRKLVLACDDKHLAALKMAEEKLSSTESNLSPHSDIYREGALDFFRKVQDEKNSVAEINALITPYCEQDHKAISDCIGGKSPVLLHLNKNIVGYMVVHPVIVPNDTKDVGLYITDRDDKEDETYVRSVDTKSESDLKHYAQELPKVITVERLDSVYKCISQVDQKSLVGQRIRNTAKISFQLSRQECLILKAKILDAKKESDEQHINLQVHVTDDQKVFCGAILN